KAGLKVAVADISDHSARLDDPASLANFVFGTKAQTLDRLRKVVRKSVILDQVSFSVEDWDSSSQAVYEKVLESFGETNLVIRSSALSEDTMESSMAGYFESVLDIDSSNKTEFCDAVGKVIQSFSQGDHSHKGNQVLVQPMVKDVTNSGVMLTRSLHTLAPYFVINQDVSSGKTDTVTSGGEGNHSTTIIYRYGDHSGVDPTIKQLVDAAHEIEEVVGIDALDIEFAMDQSNQVYVLQVRPIIRSKESIAMPDADNIEEVKQAREYVKGLLDKDPWLSGDTTVFGNMPDWNPAEMIGSNPKPLASSLYQRLITDKAWATARKEIGYKNVIPTPLMVFFAGHPYIDVRASLNSFLPVNLEDELSHKIVNAGIDRLTKNIYFHDKLEFEVAVTCLDMDFDARVAYLLEAGLSETEINSYKDSLRELTDAIVLGRSGTADEHLFRLQPLQKSLLRSRGADDLPPSKLIRIIQYLIDDCREHGLVPFSVLARFAFIAMSFLKSLVNRGVLSEDEYDEILLSIPTVASTMSCDFAGLQSGELTQDSFLEIYGHLRPGTYDITSPTYSHDPELYFGASNGDTSSIPAEHDLHAAKRIFTEKADGINQAIAEQKLSFSADELLDFILKAIPAREQAKFEFTKNLSRILELVASLGEKWNLGRDQMSYVPISHIVQFSTDHTSGDTTLLEIKRTSDYFRKRFALTQTILLPSVVTSESDLDSFTLMDSHPNFITRKTITAPVVLIKKGMDPHEMKGKIALIESADPGYDWIFQHKLAGLITKFGGAASHMAIRSAEFGIPAAIGCGEAIYDRTAAAANVTLNCAEEQIRVNS
ncbi:MAG: hypothetical protein JKX97_08760, partial [Candidatus Lindowbacteria bacterium]|nr:hypothetical protein [Candidatus Lindowbacteria bacterium]